MKDDSKKRKRSAINAKQAHDYLLALSRVTVQFAEIKRAPRYSDGNRENDAEHSFHLAITASELAADYYPELDCGLVTQFSLVHDLSELYTGDVWTFVASDEILANKKLAEQESVKRLLKELPPHTAQLLERYDKQVEPEARFVRFVDKLLPAIIYLLVSDKNNFIKDHGITNMDDLNAQIDIHTAKLQIMFPEFQFIHLVRDLILETSKQSYPSLINLPK